MATKTAIRPETPASKPWPSAAATAPPGWVVDRNFLPTSIRFARTKAGLDCTVSDYSGSAQWRVYGEIPSIEDEDHCFGITASGQASSRDLAVAVAEEAADALRLRGVIPRRAARSTSN